MYSSGGGGGGFYDTQIDGSLRFNDDDSAYLNRTPASNGNRKTWTFSAWVKRSTISNNYQRLISARGAAGELTEIVFNNEGAPKKDALVIEHYSGGVQSRLVTTPIYRDVSAWYHFVVAYDTTQSTSSNRVKLWVNGEQVTSFQAGSYPNQNIDTYMNSTQSHRIGTGHSYNIRFDGYMADVYLVDGQALTADSFGEFKSGVWIPKTYSGSYGTNGFRLKFAGNANDSSGNGNNFTANNISSYDYVPDSPTNNFATLNVLSGSNLLDNSTFSQGNLAHNSSDAYDTALATMGVKTGKWYAEIRVTTNNHMLGVRQTNALYDNSTYIGGAGGQTSFYTYGRIYTNGSYTSVTGASSGDVIQIALDADNGYVWYGRNNTWYGTVDTSTGRVALDKASHGDEFFIGSGYRDTRIWNFGQDSTFAGNTTAGGNSDDNGYGDFKYAPPSGYLALCTANLTVPEAVDPALDNSPQDYFSTLLYTGDGSSTRNLTGVGFAPDLGWFKNRSDGSRYHMIADTTRGVNKQWFTNESLAQESDGHQVKGFLSDGYTLGNNHNVNENNNSHVVWSWKADNDFMSMSTYTGNASTNNITVGVTDPDMVIFKGLTNSSAGTVMSEKMFGSWAKPLYLSSTYQGGNESPPLGVSGNTVTVYSSYGGSWNDSGVSYILYAFKEVEGHSKFGSYTGNGSTDGSFVYTGFRPAYILMKRTDSTGTWWIYDTARSTYNVVNDYLQANTSDAEGTNNSLLDIDLLSNGFKLRSSYASINASGGTYGYMAFAELPFKYANAR
jgi:hypothetical protein